MFRFDVARLSIVGLQAFMSHVNNIVYCYQCFVVECVLTVHVCDSLTVINDVSQTLTFKFTKVYDRGDFFDLFLTFLQSNA